MKTSTVKLPSGRKARRVAGSCKAISIQSGYVVVIDTRDGKIVVYKS